MIHVGLNVLTCGTRTTARWSIPSSDIIYQRADGLLIPSFAQRIYIASWKNREGEGQGGEKRETDRQRQTEREKNLLFDQPQNHSAVRPQNHSEARPKTTVRFDHNITMKFDP